MPSCAPHLHKSGFLVLRYAADLLFSDTRGYYPFLFRRPVVEATDAESEFGVDMNRNRHHLEKDMILNLCHQVSR